MIVIPAIDLRDGACVQLVGGSYEEERVRLDDALEVARGWARAGLSTVHVVDLDAATGRGSNAALIRRIVGEPGLEVQVGGGVRDEAAIGSLLAAGARRVIAGTRAIEDPEWLARASAAFPGRIIVAADVRGRAVLVRGWSRETEREVFDVVDSLAALPLAGLLVTAVHREGRLSGTDLELMGSLARRAGLPLYAAGGIATGEELRALAALGCHAAILGMALYTGAFDAASLAKEFVT